MLVEEAIVFAIFRYRRRRADEMPEQVEGNHTLEIAWTVLAFVIVGVLFVLTLRALQTDYTVEAERGENVPDLTVHVEGYLFNWDFTCFLDDGEPTGKTTETDHPGPARLSCWRSHSRDVRCSFWVPIKAARWTPFRLHQHHVAPGRRVGLYTGNCAEYCGLNHYNMLIEVDVVEPAAFDAWLAGQMATE